MNERPEPPPEGQLITAALRRMRPKVSVREAARRVGISEGWWRQIVKGYQSISGGGSVPMHGPAETVARMAQVVGLTPEQLEEAGREDAAEELRALPPAEEPQRPRTLEDVAVIAENARAETERMRATVEALTQSLRDIVGDEKVDRILEQSSENPKRAAG